MYCHIDSCVKEATDIALIEYTVSNGNWISRKVPLCSTCREAFEFGLSYVEVDFYPIEDWDELKADIET